MPEVNNKLNKAANIEATDFVVADVSAADYSTRSQVEHFGLLLTEAATLRVVTLNDTEITISFPAGWNPAALKAIKNSEANTITSVQVFY